MKVFRSRSYCLHLAKFSSLILLTIILASCSKSESGNKETKNASLPQTAVSVGEKSCDKMDLTVNSGKNIFIITNTSTTAQVEWEIIEGVKVVEEVENLAPGFVKKLKANLKPGEYGMICGRKSSPRGKITVKAI
jgi:iron uptake system component EfeO